MFLSAPTSGERQLIGEFHCQVDDIPIWWPGSEREQSTSFSQNRLLQILNSVSKQQLKHPAQYAL